MAPTSPRASVLALVAAGSLVVPGLLTPVLRSTAGASPASTADAAVQYLAATRFDLGTLGGYDSKATHVDGSVVAGVADTASEEEHAFAYDLAAAEPAMVDLGTLGGTWSHVADVSGSIVVGQSSTANGQVHAFAYDLAAAEPAMVDLGALEGGDSAAMAVDGAAVVGISNGHAFVYDLAADEPTMRPIGPDGGVPGAATAIDGSLVAGSFSTTDGDLHTFVYDLAADNPRVVDLGTLGGARSYPVGVSGTIVAGVSKNGADRTRAFVYDLAAENPRMVDLGTLGGRTAEATAISGMVVVGSSRNSDRLTRAFVYDLSASEPVMLDLGLFRGGNTWATDVDGDIVVGHWHRPDWGLVVERAFAYDRGAADPHELDLGRAVNARYELAVDGDVVVGSAGGAAVWSLGRTYETMIAFRRVDLRVKEGVGRVKIRVDRYGGTDRAATVRYRVRDGAAPNARAQAGQDFVSTSGTLRFGRGVIRRSFTVRILDDRKREGEEGLLMTLSRPSDPALLGTPRWSQITIAANDR